MLSAVVTGGGGAAATDCLLVLDAPVTYPSARPRHVRCVDGDPTCDADATVDGLCRLAIRVCVNSTFDPRCASPGVASITVEHALDNGDRKFDPDFQALQTRIDNDLDLSTGGTPDLCTGWTTFTVPIDGPVGRGRCRRGKKRLKIETRSAAVNGRPVRDRDRMKLECEPAPGDGCNPQALFTGTFDRIQRQIFDRSCAVGGCHDSQSSAGGMILEAGAAYGNLVGALPTNTEARLLGWKRVDPGTAGAGGDADASLLYHKITGDLPSPALGERMPLGRRRLHATLREIIRLWIEAGAPQTGWVPGTD